MNNQFTCTKAKLARWLYSAAHLTGEFTLRSGKISNEYFDKYLYEADPKLLREIAAHMSALIPKDTEVIAGLEMGGIPVATALSLESGIDAAFVRKQAKTHGTNKLAEGRDVSGKKVCIIEDNVTTGGQIIESAAELRKAGAVVDDVLCVVLREPVAIENLRREGLTLHYLFTMEYIKEVVSE